MVASNSRTGVDDRWKTALFGLAVLIVAYLRFYSVPDGSILDVILTVIGAVMILAFFTRAYYRYRSGKSPW